MEQVAETGRNFLGLGGVERMNQEETKLEREVKLDQGL